MPEPEGRTTERLVDPRVSRRKFDREVERYRRLEDEYIRRGWWMHRAEFPEVFVVFGTDKTTPPAVAFGAVLDFTDYDLRPPSVRLVNPFTREPYTLARLPTRLPRRVPAPAPGGTGAGDGNPTPAGEARFTELMAAHRPDDVPFLCVPGVREYHMHPAHSGDSWLLRRGGEEGSLTFILDQLYRYGVRPMRTSFQISQIFGSAADEVST